MRGRARSKKIQDLLLKFTSNKDKKRPVSESKVSRSRRRSQLMDILASKFEKSPAKISNEKISKILKESKMITLTEDSVQPFLETRSNMDKKEKENEDDDELTYTMMPIYPEQIYHQKVTINFENLKKEEERRKLRFGAFKYTNADKEPKLSVSVSPVQTQKGKKLVSQSSIGQMIRKGNFMESDNIEDIMKKRDNEFINRMKDTQGNAIQKMKHAFLNQDDRVLRKKLLDALRKRFKKMIVKDKTVEELREIYSKKEEQEEPKKVKDWMAFAGRSQLDDDENISKRLSQIGKTNKNLEER
jgi:hypothetical protein